MADGDIVHGQPYGFYRKGYEALCEGRSDYLYTLMGGLLKHIKHIGNDPIVLAKGIGEYLTTAIKNGQTNWYILSQGLDNLKNKYLGKVSHYWLEIALRAGKIILNQLKYGELKEIKNLEQIVVEQYIKELFKAGIEERIDLAPTHHENIDSKILIDRLQDIQPEIDQAIEKWSKKATENEDVSKLKRSNRKNVKPIDMDEDLLS